MTILQIELPEEELKTINERARAQGFSDSAQYVLSVVRQSQTPPYSVEDNPSPELLKREERLLLEALDDELIEVTPEVWAEFRARMDAILDGSST